MIDIPSDPLEYVLIIVTCFGNCFSESPRIIYKDISGPHTFDQCFARGYKWAKEQRSNTMLTTPVPHEIF